MGIQIVDAYWHCCGREFRDKVALVDHQLTNLEAHREALTKHIRQEARMWAILKQAGTALEMRRKLDAGEMNWWPD